MRAGKKQGGGGKHHVGANRAHQPQSKTAIASSEFKQVDNLSPSDFEIFVRDVFVAAGWSDAIITKVGQEFQHGDGGVDIFAYKSKRKFAIEVKRKQLCNPKLPNDENTKILQQAVWLSDAVTASAIQQWRLYLTTQVSD